MVHARQFIGSMPSPRGRDGTPDTSLPGTSNFAAGLGARTKMPINCHSYIDPETGRQKLHCFDDVPIEP